MDQITYSFKVQSILSLEINPSMHEVYGAFCLFLVKDRVIDYEMCITHE